MVRAACWALGPTGPWAHPEVHEPWGPRPLEMRRCSQANNWQIKNKDLLIEREELLADDIRAFFDQHDLPTPDVTVIREGEERSLIAQILPSGAD